MWVTTFAKIQSVHLEWVPTMCGLGGQVILKLLCFWHACAMKTSPAPVNTSKRDSISFRTHWGHPKDCLTVLFLSLDIYYS